jgi:hypothetical protein
MPNSDFLHQCEPPWEVFRQIEPDELSQYLKQGVTEAWFDGLWRPFWSSLSEDERRLYLDFWRASPAWRDAVAFHFQNEDEID